MNTLIKVTPHYDEHGCRALVNVIVLKTIKDAAAPRPPKHCTPHEWYLAQLQVLEWIPDYGEKRSGAAYVRKHRQMQSELLKEREEMEKKQLEGRDIAGLEEEAAKLQSEQATFGRFLLHVGEAGIERIESALIRQRAIEIRLTAITAILEAKRALTRHRAELVAG